MRDAHKSILEMCNLMRAGVDIFVAGAGGAFNK
jgi:hypothetical protein